MSELLACTVARALPLFERRWRDESGGHDHSSPSSAEWVALLGGAVRSGQYRPVVAAMRAETADADDPAQAVWAALSLLDMCVRAAYDGDPRDLPTLLHEMDAVRDLLMSATHREPENERAPPPTPTPIIKALDKAAGIVPFVTTTYEPGQIIRAREDRDPILYCLRSGHVRLIEPLPDGRTVTLAILRAGDIFGTIDPAAHQRAGAQAMTHSEVTLLHAAAFPALARIVPEAAHAAIASLATQLAAAHLLVEHLLAHDMGVRLIALLRTLADAFGEPARGGKTLIAYPATHQDLAEMIGANRVTVTRKLLNLQKAGLVIPERRNTMLIDLPGLTALLAE